LTFVAIPQLRSSWSWTDYEALLNLLIDWQGFTGFNRNGHGITDRLIDVQTSHFLAPDAQEEMPVVKERNR